MSCDVPNVLEFPRDGLVWIFQHGDEWGMAFEK